MATAIQAREWAHATLRGIGNSLYTPFCGDDGDDIDWDAYRRLVRYCVGELRHPMLWCTSGVGEFWSLTLDERKRLLEVAIEEGRAADPDVVVQACTAAMSAKDCLELTRHAQQAGADIVYLQTPMMAGAGVPILRALEVVGATSGNWVIESALNRVGEAVRKGSTIAEPLAKETVFPPMVTQMIAVGEDSGSLEQMLHKVSDFYDQEVESMTEQLTALIEPIMIAVIGVLIGGMIVALYMPIFDIYGHIH